jgi:hypothetical protein
MFDLSTASKAQLVVLHQAAAKRTLGSCKATSTLMRIKTEELRDDVENFAKINGLEIKVGNGNQGEVLYFEEIKTKSPVVEKTTETTRRGRTSSPPDDAVITVLFTTTPGRPGSGSHGRRALFTAGMTVGEYVAKTGRKGRGTLRKALRRGWVTVAPAATSTKEEG